VLADTALTIGWKRQSTAMSIWLRPARSQASRLRELRCWFVAAPATRPWLPLRQRPCVKRKCARPASATPPWLVVRETGTELLDAGRSLLARGTGRLGLSLPSTCEAPTCRPAGGPFGRSVALVATSRAQRSSGAATCVRAGAGIAVTRTYSPGGCRKVSVHPMCDTCLAPSATVSPNRPLVPASGGRSPSASPPRRRGRLRRNQQSRFRGCLGVRPQRFNAPPRTGEDCHSEWTSHAG
jgi:hypothetical protein